LEENMSKKKKERQRGRPSGVTRRGFLSSVGAGAAAVGVAGQLTAEPASATMTLDASKLVPLKLLVNGREHSVLVEPRWSLLFVLRAKLGLTGAKPGCERGECGACTVLIDDRARYACMTLAVEAEGCEITTLEGLMRGEELGPVQQAFVEHDAFQCGYCTSGQIVAAEALLRASPAPEIEEIRRGMSGNLCRCGAYAHIVEAVKKAAALKRAKGGLS
jgi:xanthine dehydrogenase YagT iron-sulfur-binding subunit